MAAAVAGGSADTGLGVLAAAQALGMDFVPLFSEQFDLVIPTAFYTDDLLRPLLELIATPKFKTEMVNLGGYDVSQTGQIIARVG